MPKTIWIINQYLTTPKINGDGYRHSYLAEHFTQKGYDVTLITSSFSHVPKKNYSFEGLYHFIEGDYRTLLVKGNKFKNSKGFPRVFSWLLFCFLLFFIPKRKLPEPDIILVSSMSLLPILNVVFYFRRKFPKSKFILEIRDIWPLTIIELGGYSKKNIFVRFMAWVEKVGYQKADHLVSVLIHADKHIKKVLGHIDFKFTWISNGYQIDASLAEVQLNSEVGDQIPKDKFIIGYAGTLGKANAMEYMIKAMNEMKGDICLCILGSGNDKADLKKMSTSGNIIFLDKIPKSEVIPFLKRCDVLYLGWHNADIYQYGISAQKIFEYMYSGRPILMSGDFPDNPVSLAQCGFVIPAEDIEALKTTMTKIRKMDSAALSQLGSSGRTYLLKNFTYSHLAETYISEVFPAEE